MKSAYILAIVLSLVWGGCGSWQDDYEWGQGVWSEDASQVAFMLDRFESKANVWSFGGVRRQRNHRLQVHAAPASLGATAEPVGPIFEGQLQSPNYLYYMADAGYALVSWYEDVTFRDEAGSRIVRYHIDRVGLDGSHRSVATREGVMMLSCDGGSSSTRVPEAIVATPSPDGNLLALVESTPTCFGWTSQVSFVRSSDLRPHSGPFTLPRHTEISGRAQLAWTPDGDFRVGYWGFGGVNGDQVSLSGIVTPFTGLAHECFYPATSSDFGNASGQGLEMRDDRLLIQDGMWSESSALGCPE